MPMKNLLGIATILICTLGLNIAANATPIPQGGSASEITLTLYGDARDGAPGDLAVDVTITFECLSACGGPADQQEWISHWSVAITAETHAD